MLKWLTSRINAAASYWQAEHFARGYCWAAGALLSGQYSTITIIDCVELFNQTPYDKGVLAAISDFLDLLNGEPQV